MRYYEVLFSYLKGDNYNVDGSASDEDSHYFIGKVVSSSGSEVLNAVTAGDIDYIESHCNEVKQLFMTATYVEDSLEIVKMLSQSCGGHKLNYGLSEERYNQMRKIYSEEEIEEIVHEGDVDDLNKGYAVTDFDGTGMLEICRIDAVMAFEDDEAAVEQAIKDGVKIIPINELPSTFDRAYLGWIDTLENREAILNYCSQNQ